MAWNVNLHAGGTSCRLGRPVSSPAARLVTHARAGRQPASARRGSQFRTAWCPARHCARANGALAASSEAPQVVYDESAEKPDELGQLGRQIKVLAGEVKQRLEGTSVYLVGMMGSGKSTVGKKVGAALGYPFLDTDTLIETSAKCSIPQIFASDGEDAFREMETQVLQQLMPYKEVVVATGGGAVVRGVNWGYLHHGIVVWLDGPTELLARRAVGDGTAKRPMLAQAGAAAQEEGGEYEAMVARIQGLLQQRGERYAAADLRVSLAAGPGSEPDAGAPAEVVTWRLLSALNERLKADGAERKAKSEAEIVITQEGLPPSMRVAPPVERDGAAPAA